MINTTSTLRLNTHHCHFLGLSKMPMSLADQLATMPEGAASSTRAASAAPPSQRARANTDGEHVQRERGAGAEAVAVAAPNQRRQPRRASKGTTAEKAEGEGTGKGKGGGKSKAGALEGDLAIAVLKSGLRSAQKTRKHSAALYDFYKVDEDSALVAAYDKENISYNKMVLNLGNGHNLGPPYPWRALALLKFMAAADPDEKLKEQGLADFKAAQLAIKTWNGLQEAKEYDPALATMIITECVLEDMWENKKVRLVLGLAGTPIRYEVAVVMRGMGMIKYAGPAPADGLELALQKGLERMTLR